ncbi:phospholipase D family protein [Xanthomonas hortorum pv. vitians]|uniref:Phospholipase D family protein n=3 Tax=Xanthomonas hortorum TaxID=56454 RepID=A0AAW8ZWD0_9XANT|nr:phospholipase D family protein [Xanthomonas hortorum]MCE4299184.1 phospholipase D family protein [Xanthomonas hortorum pv. vitians]MCE4303796.1 phospholipase D family protein [Xanthomonas hortorum pv. vitians]MCE4311449.1 phospholipase D family protein [Xanthomonas hortorum pv. vitians]MCE4341739.1 phospholipase D family protein [Xanthomonas hortorum pv. vitians]MCE4367683.1 phospholipase D family protein [Xanthomonas hortorum pv. vitians]
MTKRKMFKWIGIGALLLVLGSALSLYGYGRFADRQRGPASHALPATALATPIDQVVAPLQQAHPNQTGMVILPDNIDAFAVRALTARAAGRSLDLQYYIWHADFTGNLLHNELLHAADRGVRVRLLLDDMNIHGSDSVLAALDSHPLIEIRLFNPTRAREGTLMRGVEMVLRMFSINRRMHNKAWIVDGRIAVVGGRNVGDEYFDAARDTNFMDMDAAVMGPTVGQAEQVFDAYWNSPNALPLAALVTAEPQALDALRGSLDAGLESARAHPYVERLRQSPSVQALTHGERQVHWLDRARIVSDPPEKAEGAAPQADWMTPTLIGEMAHAQRELKVISPYFVPGEEGMRWIGELRRRNVRVSVLTNSLAANDVVAVHSGYADYRVPLLTQGVRLHELKPMGKPDGSLFGSSGASLHTKAFVVDDSSGFIGSFNLDPRSMNLNTEMGLLFDDRTVTAELERLYSHKVSAALSYRVTMDQGELRWHDDAAQPPEVWSQEPAASVWRRGAATVMGWLPLESQL